MSSVRTALSPTSRRPARHRRVDRCVHRLVNAGSDGSVSERRPVITLLTDYGLADEFVGVMHGVIATICPYARVIDLTSRNRPTRRSRRRASARAVAAVHADRRARRGRRPDGRRRSPRGRAQARRTGACWSVRTTACCGRAAQAGGGVAEAVEISESPWRLEPVSATFHGRDIFAPVAATPGRRGAARVGWRAAGSCGLLIRLETARAPGRARRAGRERRRRRPVRQRAARGRGGGHGAGLGARARLAVRLSAAVGRDSTRPIRAHVRRRRRGRVARLRGLRPRRLAVGLQPRQRERQPGAAIR